VIEDTAEEHVSKSSIGPAKYMAVEAIKQGRFSSASDVWAFAVLAYEVFADGAQPYGKTPAVEAVRKVIAGDRLSYPPQTPENLVSLFGRCMLENPEDRPTFTECEEELALDANEEEVVYASLSFVRET
jgi:serine/threonine protein kinase